MFFDFLDDVPKATYLDTLSHTHQRRIRVKVLDLNHRKLAHLEGESILDGQVTINVERRGECSRVALLRLFDPTRSIGWEPDSPSSLPLHLKRMVQVYYDVLVPGYGWVSCPVFCGPVVEVDREGAEVNVVAEGKERLALGSFGRAHTWKKGRKTVEVIAEILELAGEAASRIHLPNLPHTLPQTLNVRRTEKPWVQARKLARSLDRELFYDGRGHVRLRFAPNSSTFTVDEDFLRGPVRIDRPKLEFHNRWLVLGAKPKGAKKRVSADVALPASHALSGQSLARGGEPFWKIREEDRSQIKTAARCREIAERLRDEKIHAAADISFDCLPLPFLEEYDFVKAVDPLTGPCRVRVKQATLPLHQGDMTIGAVKQVSKVKRHHSASHGGL